ncbi:hypothetical protein [Phaeobacter inhibens]|uniref:hypothetical protein n=1 Tax=Phaeobacter inhibens TaxID=221822 RepID=UPI000C9AC66B|nr:hypothetical protein [Phaeobacter inhibens]AUQ62164.1 hypothetical protein PhaeoP51_01167 [Phaeobacter inhibens]AUQ82114.1 hypothetical protein PhaeoP57_01174 [Phaeobacter inhibens]AUQ89875.1 hypothetical protein PhaeoP24_01248 [Phaeobacter inhibens]MDO6755355.1 hypothetical protein [Phaeobacter inhibens]
MANPLLSDIEQVQDLLKDREQAGGDLASALKHARRRLPRRIYRQGMRLAEAQHFLAHPKLRLTVEHDPLQRAAREVIKHLKSIDLADRRRGRLLDIVATIAFSLIVVAILLVVVLRWRGFV